MSYDNNAKDALALNSFAALLVSIVTTTFVLSTTSATVVSQALIHQTKSDLPDLKRVLDSVIRLYS